MSYDHDEDERLRRELFLLAVADGVPQDNAAYEVGWTPAGLRRKLKDPEFVEMIEAATNRAVGSVEAALFKLARDGKNLGAMQMVLYNLRSDRWKDVRRIEIKQDTTVNIGIVHSTKQAVMELLRERGPAALQPSPLELPAALDEDVQDAEVIDDDA